MKQAILATIMLFAFTSANATVYKVDTKESAVTWKAGKKIGSFHNGGIAIKSGEMQADAKGNFTGGTVVVDMATITNDDLKDSPDNQKKLVGHLSSDDFFKVAQHPTSTFKLVSFTPDKKDKTQATVKGELTMIGKTVPVEFPVKITTEKDKVIGEATLKIERLKWGLQYGSGSIFKSLTADKIINDEFELGLKIVAKK